MSVAGGAEEAEEVDEEVDEVEVEGEGAPCGDVLRGDAGVGGCELLDFLGIPCGEADEDEHTGAGDNPVKGGVGPEDVDNNHDEQAEKRHVEERTDLGEVACGEISVDAHGPEGAGADKECLEKGGEREFQAENRQRKAVDYRKEIKQSCGHGRSELVEACRNDEHKHKFQDCQTPVDHAVAVDIEGQVGFEESHAHRYRCRYQQGEKHLHIHVFHHLRHAGVEAHFLLRLLPVVLGAVAGLIIVVHNDL